MVKMNEALQGKWLWRYWKEENRMWKKVIEARRGSLKQDNSNFRQSIPHGRGLWKKVLTQWPRFGSCTRWKLGRGNKINFWHDDWTGEGCFKSCFSRIYDLAQSRNMLVENTYQVKITSLSGLSM